MLPENSAGPSIETFMIGSRIFGLRAREEVAERAARGFLERDVARVDRVATDRR